MKQNLQRLIDDYSKLSPGLQGSAPLLTVMDDLGPGLGFIQESPQGLEVDPNLNEDLRYIQRDGSDFVNNLLIPDIKACL